VLGRGGVLLLLEGPARSGKLADDGVSKDERRTYLGLWVPLCLGYC
jgi:hypothetical protein